MSLSDMVVEKSGLLVELRCHNSFNEKIYTDITNYLNKHLTEWKSTGFIPVADAVSIFNLIDELSGGSQFWSEEVELRQWQDPPEDMTPCSSCCRHSSKFPL